MIILKLHVAKSIHRNPMEIFLHECKIWLKWIFQVKIILYCYLLLYNPNKPKPNVFEITMTWIIFAPTDNVCIAFNDINSNELIYVYWLTLWVSFITKNNLPCLTYYFVQMIKNFWPPKIDWSWVISFYKLYKLLSVFLKGH